MSTKLYRTTYIDQDNRRAVSDDKIRCIRCYKEIKNTSASRSVHLVDGGPFALHPDDEAIYAMTGNKAGDMGYFDIGLDCAKRIGIEFTRGDKSL